MEKGRLVIIGKGMISKLTITKLKSIPLDLDDSVYSKRISWVHMRTMTPLQVDYYKAGSEAPVKRMKVNKLQKLQGYWTVVDSTVFDLEKGRQTRMVTRAIKYDQQLPATLFSRRTLSDTRLEKAYRP